MIVLGGCPMNEFNKYKILSAGKAFGHRAKIALQLMKNLKRKLHKLQLQEVMIV